MFLWAPPFLEVEISPFFEVWFPREEPVSNIGLEKFWPAGPESFEIFLKSRPILEVQNFRNFESVCSFLRYENREN